MVLVLTIPVLALLGGQNPNRPAPPFPDPTTSDARMNERQLRTADFAAIVEPSGDGEVVERTVEFGSVDEGVPRSGWPAPDNREKELMWSQPFRVLDSFGTGIGGTVTGSAFSRDPDYRNLYGLSAGPKPAIGGGGGGRARYLLVGTAQHAGSLGIERNYEPFRGKFSFATERLGEVRSPDEAMVYALYPTKCERLAIGGDMAATILRTLAASACLGGGGPVDRATEALTRIQGIGPHDAEPIESLEPMEWRDRVLAPILAQAVRSHKLAPAEQVRVSSLLFAWGDDAVHDEYMKALVARDRSGEPMSQDLFAWCTLVRRVFPDDLQTRDVYQKVFAPNGDGPLYEEISDPRSKILFMLDWWGKPKLDSTYKLLLRDLRSDDDMLVDVVLRSLYDWSGAKPALEPDRYPGPDKPRPEQWQSLIDHWSKPGAFDALVKGSG